MRKLKEFKKDNVLSRNELGATLGGLLPATTRMSCQSDTAGPGCTDIRIVKTIDDDSGNIKSIESEEFD